MRLLERIRVRVRDERFHPRWLGVATNPSYIIRRALRNAIIELAPKIRGKVLDFGCGSKPYEPLFSRAVSYIGVDIEVSGHQHGDSKVDRFYDGKTLPFDDNEFDAVVSFEVFEHVFNLREVLTEIRRVLRESGLLLLSIPFAWEEHETPYDYARYTTFGICHILSSQGFEVVELRKTTTYLLAIWQMLLAYMDRIGPRGGFTRYLYRIGILAPGTLAGYIVDALTPKRYEYFCNAVVLARKVPRGEHLRTEGAGVAEENESA